VTTAYWSTPAMYPDRRSGGIWESSSCSESLTTSSKTCSGVRPEIFAMRSRRARVSCETVGCITVPRYLRSNSRGSHTQRPRRLLLFRLLNGTAHDHLVEQLADEAEGVDLIVMLASGEAQ
jgi:hypothetical protein